MTETYNLRLSKHDLDVSNPDFVSWLKENGHQVLMTDNWVSIVNDIPVSYMPLNTERQQWVHDVLIDLLAQYITESQT